MIAVAIVVTTVLLSWVNYGMFKNRVMDDLRTYGRVFSRILPDDEGTEEEESLARQMCIRDRSSPSGASSAKPPR